MLNRFYKIAVLVSGNGTNLQALIDAVNNNEISAEITLVVSNNDSAYALHRAKKHNISSLCLLLKSYIDNQKTRKNYDHDLANILFEAKVDIIVFAGWMHIVNSEFLNILSHIPIINIHPALPNMYTGKDAIKNAFNEAQQNFQNNSDIHQETGVMVHHVVSKVDKGECIVYEKVEIYKDDSLQDLKNRIQKVENRLVVEAIRKVLYKHCML